MFFTGFVQERGSPWRVCDLWDELYSNLGEQLRQEALDPRLVITHIQELAQQLFTNENPNPQPYVQKILRPPDGAFTRIHQPELPQINSSLVQKIIDEELSKTSLKARLSSMRTSLPRILPMGPQVSNIQDLRPIVTNSARRLEVLRNCINCIFDNKISDARKTFPAVLRALKSKQARLALCTELAQHVVGNKAMLEHQQFDLVVRLMNCALQDDSVMDGHGVAAALLPLATAFCRKLCTGVIQFAYTCIQDHRVWQNQQFWEASFYLDVQKDIKALYLQRSDTSNSSPTSRLGLERDLSLSPVSPRDSKEILWKDRRSVYLRPQEPSALEIAAEQMRLWPNYEPGIEILLTINKARRSHKWMQLSDKQTELTNSEESTMYSQAIHYANRMVYLLVPLDSYRNHHRGAGNDSHPDEERASNSITNSVVESDSLDAESGFEEQDPGEVGLQVVRSVSRFVDKVCTEGGVSAEHIRCLHQMVPGVVHMHVETLEAVHRESKRLPPIQKPKITTPTLLPGEELMLDGIRVYLLPDGREEHTGGLVGGPTLLPAEGAIFLTNYRIIFRGTPCDPFACEQVVVRAFPVTSLTKEKRISVQYPAHLDQWLQEGLQIRSCTFQDDSVMDGHGVAAALLPLATAFCRKLCTGVIQFAYTCIQDHRVWQNQQFWEASFYLDVQKDIKALYLQRSDTSNSSPTSRLGLERDLSLSPVSPRDSKEILWKDRRSVYLRPQEPSALEIAAEQMRLWPNYEPGIEILLTINKARRSHKWMQLSDKQTELTNSEESTMYSQAIHYANRMVYLLVPLDSYRNHHRGAGNDSHPDEERASNSITNSVVESDSLDAESGFEEQDPGEVGLQVVRSVSRFVDKVCTEGGVSAEHIRCLHQMVPGVVHMHVETLEAVHRESKRLPPIQKPKITTPTLLPGEELMLDGIRVYLLPDGREEHTGGLVGGPTLLPAEGAIFLTNYRIIFRGTPCDPFVF
ncbi:hypothetical protein B566_EDAN002610 [Ephemera danica]|nr:hypothetical protein B566_EDAN002610 [Ephemera danica]